MASTDITPCPCPHCGALMEVALSHLDPTPEPGAVAMCGVCGGLAKFTEALTLSPLEECPPEIEDEIRWFREALSALRSPPS